MTTAEPRYLVDVQVAPAFAEWVDAEMLTMAAQATLESENWERAELAVVITDDECIREMNRTYADTDAATDVLSFSAREGAADFVVADPEADAYLGDIMISFPTALAQAEARGLPVARELALLTIHGTLHLLDHDHAEADDEARMWARQEAVLRALGFG